MSKLRDHPFSVTPRDKQVIGVGSSDRNKEPDRHVETHTEVAIEARMTMFSCKEQPSGRSLSDTAMRRTERIAQPDRQVPLRAVLESCEPRLRLDSGVQLRRHEVLSAALDQVPRFVQESHAKMRLKLDDQTTAGLHG